jgi:hypothetical protein
MTRAADEQSPTPGKHPSVPADTAPQEPAGGPHAIYEELTPGEPHTGKDTLVIEPREQRARLTVSLGGLRALALILGAVCVAATLATLLPARPGSPGCQRGPRQSTTPAHHRPSSRRATSAPARRVGAPAPVHAWHEPPVTARREPQIGGAPVVSNGNQPQVPTQPPPTPSDAPATGAEGQAAGGPFSP